MKSSIPKAQNFEKNEILCYQYLLFCFHHYYQPNILLTKSKLVFHRIWFIEIEIVSK